MYIGYAKLLSQRGQQAHNVHLEVLHEVTAAALLVAADPDDDHPRVEQMQQSVKLR